MDYFLKSGRDTRTSGPNFVVMLKLIPFEVLGELIAADGMFVAPQTTTTTTTPKH